MEELMIVDIARIHQLFNDDVTSTLNGTAAVGRTDDETHSPLYDPLWGYFTFGQSINAEYQSDGWVYTDTAAFTIEGVFTADSVVGDVTAMSDDQVFVLMVAAYTTLENTFKAAATATAPASYTSWGTSLDPRCIVLPNPLCGTDSSGNAQQIYALVDSVRVDKTQYPFLIRYTATLHEAKPPAYKLMVNSNLLDDAMVHIEFPRPELSRYELIRCAGEVIQVKYYQPMVLDVSASVPLDDFQNMVGTLYDQQVTIVVAQRASGALSPFYSNLNLVSDVDVDTDLMHRLSRVQMKLKQ